MVRRVQRCPSAADKVASCAVDYCGLSACSSRLRAEKIAAAVASGDLALLRSASYVYYALM